MWDGDGMFNIIGRPAQKGRKTIPSLGFNNTHIYNIIFSCAVQLFFSNFVLHDVLPVVEPALHEDHPIHAHSLG